MVFRDRSKLQADSAAPSNPSRPPLTSKRRLGLSLILLLGVAAVVVLVDAAILAMLHSRNQIPHPAVLPHVPHLRDLLGLVKDDPRNSELRLALAQVYLRENHYQSARGEFDLALQLGADEWACRTGRAQANLKIERYERAAEDIRHLIRLRPEAIETYLTLAEMQQHSDGWSAANRTLDSIPRDSDGLPKTNGRPDSLTAAELLATAYSHIDRWDKTLALVRKCLEREPSRPSSRIMLGKALHATGRPVEAISYLQEAAKTQPDSAELVYLLGTAYLARKEARDEDRALTCFQRAVVLDGKHGGATLALARILDRRKMYEAAAVAYYRAYKLGMEGELPLLRSSEMMLRTGKKEEAWYRRGLYFETTGRPDLALREYTRLTTLHHSCRSGYIHMARAFGAMRKHEKALEYLRKACDRDPARARELDWLMIDALGQTHEDNTRIKMLQAIVKEGGKEGNEAAFQLAKLTDAAGKRQEAEKWLRTCVQNDPKDAVFRLELGKFLLQQRSDPAKLQSAIGELEESVRLDRTSREATYSLGLAYSYAGRLEEAVFALRHAVDLQPENGAGYQALAQVLKQAGKHEEAADTQQVFRRFEVFKQTRETLIARCKRQPTNPDAQFRIAEFHMNAQEYPAAIQRYRKALQLQPENRKARARLAEACGYLGRREEQRAQLALLRSSGPRAQ